MRFIIGLIILATISACKDQREQVEKFTFDSKQISTKSAHRYEFNDNGKVKTVYTTDFKYMAGLPFDSATYVKRYEYNAKGQIASIFDSVDSTTQTKFYNQFDSLVADYTINNYGDTTRLLLTDYMDGKRTKGTIRILSMRIPEDFKNLKREDLRNYDTLFSMTKYIYEGDLHTKSLSLDKNGVTTEEIENFYEGNHKIKSITYSFLGDAKFISQTTIFSENNANDPDQWTTGIEGDTIAFRKTIFENETRIIINHMGQFHMQDLAYYNKSDQLIATVLLNLADGVKTVYSYTYDNKGYVTEESRYVEKANNAL